MTQNSAYDLGSILSRMLDVIVEREAPILASHDLTMWEYAVLLPLEGATALSQVELARRSRRDPTRLGGHIKDLTGRGLIVRRVDELDRRRHVIELTERGRTVLAGCRSDIHAMEEEVLGALDPAEQEGLRSALASVLQHLRDAGWERS